MVDVRSYFELKIKMLEGYKIKGDIANAGMHMTYIFGWLHGIRDVNAIDNDTMSKWIDEVNKVDNRPSYTKKIDRMMDGR